MADEREASTMAKPTRFSPEEARQRAEERFARLKQRDDDARKAYEELERSQQAEAAKTARLRALRLAKEAADIEAANRAAVARAAAAQSAAQRRAAGRRRKAQKA
jgi:hypothetical protein